MSITRINNCFDSHVHWRATGDFAERISLEGLKTPQDILSLSCPSVEKGAWVLGLGWSFSDEDMKLCTAELLDQWCSDVPVALSKNDGHSLWVNTAALKAAGMSEEKGLLKENARLSIFTHMPKPSMGQITRQLMKAQKIFHDYGITHIRDVHMTNIQWAAAKHLEESGLLKLAVEAFVYDESLSFDESLSLALDLKRSSSDRSLLRLKGVKVFVDGSLGSETALISRPYLGKSHQGERLIGHEELVSRIEKAWSLKLEVACHCIGDEAADVVARACMEVLEKGIKGKVHFEHAQILRDETIALMKQLECSCHLQPGHWLDDKSWLSQKLENDLVRLNFPWRRLQEADISFFFGSDSPISKPGVARIFHAIEDASQNSIPRLLGTADSYVGHPDLSWPANTFTEFKDGEVHSIIFKGEPL